MPAAIYSSAEALADRSILIPPGERMPYAPRAACPEPYCPNVRPCPTHERPSSSTAQGYGARHRAWRQAVLARDPVCREEGCEAPATEADHIRPIRLGGAQYDLGNGQGLCKGHHSAKTRRDERLIAAAKSRRSS